VNGSADLLGGVLYQPYYYLTMILGAVVVWFGPQTWDYTRKITPVKAVLILGLFGLSLVILTTQSFNPFIYFIF
jgi:alginate O-acetyltransferase complex protein AlgI